MICVNCGGEIQVDGTCMKCGISYDEMISNIRHDEIIMLLDKLQKVIIEGGNFKIIESLFACELLNSHLLIAAEDNGDDLAVGSAESDDGKTYILLFTDKEEYDKLHFDIKPKVDSFKEYIKLLGNQHEGFIINFENQGCQIPKEFLEKYFEGDIDV